MTHRSYISSALFGKSVIAVSVKKAVVFHLLNNKPEFVSLFIKYGEIFQYTIF